MTTWHQVPEGTEIESPPVTVTDQLVEDLVRLVRKYANQGS